MTVPFFGAWISVSQAINFSYNRKKNVLRRSHWFDACWNDSSFSFARATPSMFITENFYHPIASHVAHCTAIVHWETATYDTLRPQTTYSVLVSVNEDYFITTSGGKALFTAVCHAGYEAPSAGLSGGWFDLSRCLTRGDMSIYLNSPASSLRCWPGKNMLVCC